MTRVVFVRGLSSRARAPSFCSVCEYLKRTGQRGALAAVCTPTIKSASEKHQRDTPPYRNTVNGCSEGGKITGSLMLSSLIACEYSGCASKTTRVCMCKTLTCDPCLKHLKPLLKHLRCLKAHLKCIKTFNAFKTFKEFKAFKVL